MSVLYSSPVITPAVQTIPSPRTITVDETLVPRNLILAETILIDATAGDVTATLPAQADVMAGKRYTIKLISGPNDMIVDAADSVDIDLVSQYETGLILQSFTFEADGSQWWVVN